MADDVVQKWRTLMIGCLQESFDDNMLKRHYADIERMVDEGLAAVAPLIRAAECATLRAHVEALTAALRINGMRQGATHAQIDDWMVMINIAALKGSKP